jgi:hypothetical protein
MVPGSLVSNKQSVNPSIISAHPVYESQRTCHPRAQIKQNLHQAAQCRWRADLLAQLARERERRRQRQARGTLGEVIIFS